MLNLSRNNIATIPPEIGQLTNLTSLVLYGNKIHQLACRNGKPDKANHLSAFEKTGSRKFRIRLSN